MFAIKSLNIFIKLVITLNYVLILIFDPIICFNKYINEYDLDPKYYANKDLDYFIPSEDMGTGVDKDSPSHVLPNDLDSDQLIGNPITRSRKSSSQRENPDEYNDPINILVGSSSASIKENMVESSIGPLQSAGVGDRLGLSSDASGAGAKTENARAFANQYNRGIPLYLFNVIRRVLFCSRSTGG